MAKRLSYAETFDKIVAFMLQQGKKEVSPLQFIMKDVACVEWTPLIEKKVGFKGYAAFTVKELEELYQKHHPDDWPFHLQKLQRMLGINSRVIQQNITAFGRVRRDEEKKKEKGKSRNTRINADDTSAES